MRISKVVVAFSLVFWSKAKTSETNRKKRGNQDNFNILLNMYKLNPLKHSNVFKAFSNQVLLPRQELPDLNLNTKESFNEEQNRINFKKKYREILHYSKPNKLAKDPSSVDNLRAESFNSGNLDDLLTFNQINVDKKSYDDADIFEDNFVPKTAKQPVKKTFRDRSEQTNTIDLDSNIYVPKKKRKRNKKRYHPNAEIILA